MHPAGATSTRPYIVPPSPFSGHPTSLPPLLKPRNFLSWPQTKRPQPVAPIFSSVIKEEQQINFTEPETELIDALMGIQGRGRSASPQQLQDVERSVQILENLTGVPDPTSSSLIEGSWQLMFTTRPGTASPIQRTFVGVDIFRIFQEVYLRTDDPRVSNIVKFSDEIGELKVEAEAKIQDGKRILFRFDRAAFSFKFLPFKVPYPVPFRLLGDEAKGWLDTTYLSYNGNIRISRGNKGTTFVLQKKIEPRQQLLSAISIGKGVEEIVDELRKETRKSLAGKLGDLEGEWQLIWASQHENERFEVKAAKGLKGVQIIKSGGRVENITDLLPGVRICAYGKISENSDGNSYDVNMTDGAIRLGMTELPLKILYQCDMELLYIDNKIRITRSNEGVILIHLRTGG